MSQAQSLSLACDPHDMNAVRQLAEATLSQYVSRVRHELNELNLLTRGPEQHNAGVQRGTLNCKHCWSHPLPLLKCRRVWCVVLHFMCLFAVLTAPCLAPHQGRAIQRRITKKLRKVRQMHGVAPSMPRISHSLLVWAAWHTALGTACASSSPRQASGQSHAHVCQD